MKKIEAIIVADSKNSQGDRITTYELTFPRFILAELLTHRLFSRNSASSRAIPFKTMLKSVEEDPFIPIAWQKDHKGMQGTEYFKDSTDLEWLKNNHLAARDYAVERAKAASDKGLTKQIVNRYLEPFLWHKVLVTATHFDNFFELRCPKYYGVYKSQRDLFNGKDVESRRRCISDVPNEGQGEIHIMALAEAMWDAKNESTPKKLEEDEWHIPFGDKIDTERIDKVFKVIEGPMNRLEAKIQIATARCARISYNNFEGKDDYEADIKLYYRLKESGHFSPFEHCARAMTQLEYQENVKGKVYVEHDEKGEEVVDLHIEPSHSGWCLNFKGFIQLRAEL